MYNPLLDTFLTAADTGSFNRAAAALYLSPTAVMKQVNALEAHLGLRLFERGRAGLALTPAGASIYRDAKFLREYSAKALAAAKSLSTEQEKIFRVGTSLLNPAKPFVDLWYRLNSDFRDYKLHLVSFEDDCDGILKKISELGSTFDFLVGVCDSREWLTRACFLPLGRYRKMVAVRRGHPLAAKALLTVEDLEGWTLMMVPEWDSGVNDFIRNDLTRHHPKIRIEDTRPYYDLTVFNRCAETDHVLLLIECWQNVHPGLVAIPVDWEYSIPYGILYAGEPAEEVRRFLGAVQERIPETEREG